MSDKSDKDSIKSHNDNHRQEEEEEQQQQQPEELTTNNKDAQKTSIELATQKQALDKLFKRIDKPVVIPEPRIKKLKPPPDFVRNVSGKLHQKADEEFKKRQQENEAKEEQERAKRRAKRQKRKQNSKKNKSADNNGSSEEKSVNISGPTAKNSSNNNDGEKTEHFKLKTEFKMKPNVRSTSTTTEDNKGNKAGIRETSDGNGNSDNDNDNLETSAPSFSSLTETKFQESLPVTNNTKAESSNVIGSAGGSGISQKLASSTGVVATAHDGSSNSDDDKGKTLSEVIEKNSGTTRITPEKKADTKKMVSSAIKIVDDD
ncbi:hypothetical protein H4219_005046 [Mycoemilia scoparia]|uniref:Uncharacterized protein n=1 Tax=Mycoemilia scoparia TaxID=417184 RepID=A0A9W7ZZ37_9FUNG|nr:hypothetical protein H4219_005046 [Mycoemilia scoparia]